MTTPSGSLYPLPEFRPSANCSVPDCTDLDAIGWYWDPAEPVWRSACEAHAEIIPAWRKGDWRVKTKLVRTYQPAP